MVNESHIQYDGTNLETGEQVEILTPTQNQTEPQINEWNNMDADIPLVETLHQLFEKEAKRAPDKLAIICQETRLTYKELSQRSNQLACHLQTVSDIKPDALIALFLDRSEFMIISILATWKSGAAHVPIDPGYPDSRVKFILEDTQAMIVITNQHYIDRLKESCLSNDHIHIIEVEAFPAPSVTETPVSKATSSDLCYVTYTSGTTGLPKGVMKEHQSVVKSIANLSTRYKIREGHHMIALFSAYVFEPFLRQMLMALLNSQTLVVVRDEVKQDPLKFNAFLRFHEITYLNGTASVLQQYSYSGTKLTKLLFAGEELTKNCFDKIRKTFKGTVINEYGPTESAFVTAYKELSPTDQRVDRSIGKPVSNNIKCYILDDQFQQVPTGEVGEIFIGGAGVSRGYLNCPDLTASRFLKNPFQTDNEKAKGLNARIYKTGDLVRRLPNGELEFLGRSDNQIKINGFRIEPSGVENFLCTYPGIKQCVVIAKESRNSQCSSSVKHLVGYIVIDGTAKRLENDIKAFLETKLPSYMVPSRILQIEKIPVTINGKLDAKALPDIEYFPPTDTQKMKPRSPTELTLCKIWADVFEIPLDQISINDDFFQVGGDSIKSIQLIGQMRKYLNLSISITDIFNLKTIENLANHLKVEKEDGFIKNEKDVLEKSSNIQIHNKRSSDSAEYVFLANSLQQGFMYHHLKKGATDDAYIIQNVYQYNSEIQIDKMHQAWEYAQAKFFSLRLKFFASENKVIQVIDKSELLDWRFMEISEKTPIEQDKLIKHIQETDRKENYLLEKGNLFRLYLIKQHTAQFTFLFSCHHIILDGWSFPVLFNYVHETYLQLIRGDQVTIAVDFSYLEAQIYLQIHHQDHVDYWSQEINRIEERCDLNGLLKQKHKCKVNLGDYDYVQEQQEKTLSISGELYHKLKEMCSVNCVTLHSILQFVWHKILSIYGNSNQTVVGTIVSGRNIPVDGIENTVGLFINTLPLIVEHEQLKEKTVVEAIKSIQSKVQEINSCSHVELAQLNRGEMKHQLFDSLFVLENYVKGDKIKIQLHNQLLKFESKYTYEKLDYPLAVVAKEIGESIAFTIMYAGELLEDSVITQLLDLAKALLGQITRNYNYPVDKLEFLTPAEELILEKWNDTTIEFPSDKTLHQIFEEMAKKWPWKIAIIYEDRSLTYKQLNDKSNQVAHYLRSLTNIHPDTLIALFLDKSELMIVSILGIWKSGAAYVPIDPSYADERIQFILKDTQTKVIVTNQCHAPKLRGNSYTDQLDILEIEALYSQSYTETEAQNPSSISSGTDLAYVIYTSGTTGNPKGVMVEHIGVVNLQVSLAKIFSLQERNDEVLFSFSNYVFDHFVEQMTDALLNGQTLLVLNDEMRLDKGRLYQYMSKNKVTYLSGTPSVLQMYEYDKFNHCITRIDAVGEDFNELVFNKLRCSFGGLIINGYGPTEISITSHKRLYPFEERRTNKSIGTPVANTTCYVLNRDLKRVPIGGVGELFIGGAGVARGYLNRPELTADRFLINPFQTDEDKLRNRNSRIYKTGDMVRWLPNGEVEYLGRNDFQVKIRGLRIELGEIEFVLSSFPGITQAVVMAKNHLVKDDKDSTMHNQKYLVGYYISNKIIKEAAIKKFMRKKLPEYMIPNKLVPIDKIQVTISGKLDTKSLPEIEFSKPTNSYIAPKNEIQRKLCHIWSDLLGIPVENIGIHDDFFSLGGDSLLVQRLFFKLSNTFSTGITVASIFQHRNIESMYNHICNLDDSLTFSMIQLKSQQHVVPVSFAQERLMFIDEYEGGTNAYNISLHLEIPSKIDKCILKQSLQSVVARHEILRTLIARQQGNGPYLQLVIDQEQANSMFVVQETDINDIDELNQKLTNASKHIFHLDKELPIWVSFYTNNMNKDFYIMSVILHHICFDGWSWKIFQRDLKAFYDFHSTNNRNQCLSLPNLNLQYKDFAIWQREAFSEKKIETLLTFWKSKLECFENLQLVSDFPHPAHFDYSGKDINFELDKELTTNLKQLAMELNISLFSLLVSAYCLVLGNYANQKDIVIGTPVANRNRPELENVIGFFVNMLVLRIQTPSKWSTIDYIQKVSNEVINAQIHQDMPFEKLVRELKIEKDLSRHPIVQAVFSLNPFETILEKNSINSDSALKMTTYILENNDHQIAKYDISTTISEYETSIKGHFNYATKLFHESTVCNMIETYKHILKQFAKLNRDSEHKLGDIECFDTNSVNHFVPAEVGCSWSSNKTLNHLFEDEVEKSSNKIAVVSGNVKLTYAELNKKSNRLAHYLHSVKSISPDSLIGLLLDRNENIIISILGVWKAGAAYIPIDPSYPDDRIKFFLEETKVKIIITNQHYGSKLKGITTNSNCAIVEIDNPGIAKSINMQPITNYRSDSNENNLAYVIYTSGTSGKPKGVLVAHKGIANLRNDLIVRYFGGNLASDQQQAILLLSNYVFDFSVEQIILSILSSNKLILVPNKILIEDQFYDYLNINSLSYLSGTPSYIHQIDLTKLKHLRTLTVAGEVFTKKHFEKIRKEFNGTLNNAYGITETTIYNMVYRFEGEAEYKNSLGQILSNMKLYILNENLQQLPKGAVGELYLSGNCVAYGYLNHPDLTAERFLQNPFQTEEDKRTGQFCRMYKSGDLVRYRYDGELEYVGRNDFQVKIRGLRIELGEIETILASFPGVKQCTVIAKSHHSDVSSSSQFLVGYFVSERNCKIEEDQIKTFMLRKLPDYMVPVKLICVNDHLPITINGKLDIQSLPKIDFSADKDTFVPPRNALENQLCCIWSQILGMENISIDDDFFKIGGDSIMSQQLVGCIRHDLKVKISVKDIFVYKTIRHLYEHVLQNGMSDNRCPKINSKVEDGVLSGELPLLPIQKWFFSKNLKNCNHWNQTFVIKTPELDMEKLKNAVIKLIEHHDAFRLRFKSRDGIFVQYYDSEDFSFPLHTHDATKDQNLKQTIAKWQSGLDIKNGPIFCVAYMHGYEDGWSRLLFIMHHLIIDTVSWRIIRQDLHTLYNGGDLGRKGSSYRQWTQAIQQFSQNSQSEAGVWQKLANKVQDFNENLSKVANNEKSVQTNFVLTNDQTETILKKCNVAYATQINDLLLTALAYALSAVTQNEVSYVTLEGHGREEINNSLDISRTIGWFTTMYPVELCLGSDLSNSIQNVKTSLNSFTNKGLYYGTLMGYDERLPRVSFNYLGRFDPMPKEAWNFENLIGEYDLNRSIDSQQADHDLISVTALCSERQMRFNVSSRLGDSKADQFSSVLKMKLGEIISNSTKKTYNDQSKNGFIQEFDPYVEFSGKSDTILFMFPPGEGGAESYINNLVRKLNSFKLIVFNNFYLHTNKRSTTFEKLAEFYISYIKQIQPQGPYNFFGWSFGGVLGLEISRQMVENGDTVTNLIIVDSYFNVQKACEDIQHTEGFIVDRINYLYSHSQKQENFEKLASTVQNLVLFKACQLNDTFKTADEKMLYEYFMHSQCNNLDTLFGCEFIKLILMQNETHTSWVYNEDQLTSMSDRILSLFQ